MNYGHKLNKLVVKYGNKINVSPNQYGHKINKIKHSKKHSMGPEDKKDPSHSYLEKY